MLLWYYVLWEWVTDVLTILWRVLCIYNLTDNNEKCIIFHWFSYSLWGFGRCLVYRKQNCLLKRYANQVYIIRKWKQIYNFKHSFAFFHFIFSFNFLSFFQTFDRVMGKPCINKLHFDWLQVVEMASSHTPFYLHFCKYLWKFDRTRNRRERKKREGGEGEKGDREGEGTDK